MTQIQGVLLCSGNGSRFAKSVGGAIPYPKHLEMLGNKSVLGRAVDSLVQNIGVSGITFSLNPYLQNEYISHLRMLQDDHPTVPFTYMYGKASDNQGLPAQLKEGMRHAYTLDRKQIEFGNPLVASAFGDTITSLDEPQKLQELIRTTFSNRFFKEKTNIHITPVLGGMLYNIAYLDRTTDSDPATRINIFANEYGLSRGWNINTRTHLIDAKLDYGYPLTDDERASKEGGPRREFR